MAVMPTDPPCPCGLPARLSACCGRWFAGPLHLQAPDAAALMRSRYSAYVLRLADYLLATWHPATRPAALEVEPVTMMQIVPVGSQARRAALVARLLGPVPRLVGMSMLALVAALGLLRRQNGS